jgi:hypothetical protein
VSIVVAVVVVAVDAVDTPGPAGIGRHSMRLLSKRLLILDVAVVVAVAVAVAVAVVAAKGLGLQAARSPSVGRLNPSRGSIGVAVAVVVAAGTASSGAGPFSHGWHLQECNER